MISVVIPYGGRCPHRARALTYVTSRYEDLGYGVVVGAGDEQRWCKAEAIADALTRARGDLLIVADGDVWSDHLIEAIDEVQSGAFQWAMPHWHVFRLTERGTDLFIAGEREDRDVEEEHHGIVGGGIVVLHRETYERAPLDPRFVGWGGEDRSWAYALRTLAGRPFRARQPLWHLWHPPQQRRDRVVGNVHNDQLRQRYAGAAQQPRLMRALIDEGRAWASNVSSSSLSQS